MSEKNVSPIASSVDELGQLSIKPKFIRVHPL
jgi:hypothetical protein